TVYVPQLATNQTSETKNQKSTQSTFPSQLPDFFAFFRQRRGQQEQTPPTQPPFPLFRDAISIGFSLLSNYSPSIAARNSRLVPVRHSII
ncbi:MAG: hypothetical protein ACXW32_07640, partial [Limisphaerales bacterium]